MLPFGVAEERVEMVLEGRVSEGGVAAFDALQQQRHCVGQMLRAEERAETGREAWLITWGHKGRGGAVCWRRRALAMCIAACRRRLPLSLGDALHGDVSKAERARVFRVLK